MGLRVRRGIFALVALVACAAPVAAQSTVNATATDSSTGVRVQLADSVARSIRVAIKDASGNPFGTAGNPIRVDPTGSTTQPVSGSVTATQATGTNLHIVCDSGCSSSTAPSDASAFTAASTSFSPIGGFFQTTATSNALTTGQMGAFQVTANRALFTNLRNASGTEIGTSTTPVQVSLANTGANTNKLLVTPDSVALPANQSVNLSQVAGVTTATGNGIAGTGVQRVTIASDNTAFSVSASQNGTWTVQPGNTANTTAWLFAGGKTNNNAAPGATNIGVLPMIANATAPSWTEGNLVNGSSDLHGSQRVTILTSAGAAATLATDATGAATASTTGPQVMLNGVTSEPTAVTTGQATQFTGDLVGKLVTSPYAVSDLLVSGVTASDMTGTTSTSLIAAPAANLRNYITQITCTNSHATVSTFVLVQDGSGGTTLYKAYAAAVGGGFALTFPAPLRQPTTATALFVADVTTGANVSCSASGFKGR